MCLKGFAVLYCGQFERYCGTAYHRQREKSFTESSEYVRSVAVVQKEQKIQAAVLQKISAQTGLAFSKLLGAVVLEEVARLICESEYSGEFWLRNGNILTRENYERNLELRLEFDYVIQKPPRV